MPAPANVFVIPAYNEVENLPRLFQDLEARPSLFPPNSRLIIVDDGSEDGTAELVDEYVGSLPVEVIRLGRNQGPGAAFRARGRPPTCGPQALVVTLEADTTGDLDALPQMLERAAAGAELVLASWVMSNVGWSRRLLSACAGLVVRRVLGVHAHTVSSFFRVYRASLLQAAVERYGDSLIREPGFACKAELLSKLDALGARIEEVPVGLDWSRRVGASKMPLFRTIVAYWRMMARRNWERATA
jgi:dolichol-phosphate mannosyltransferase